MFRDIISSTFEGQVAPTVMFAGASGERRHVRFGESRTVPCLHEEFPRRQSGRRRRSELAAVVGGQAGSDGKGRVPLRFAEEAVGGDVRVPCDGTRVATSCRPSCPQQHEYICLCL